MHRTSEKSMLIQNLENEKEKSVARHTNRVLPPDSGCTQHIEVSCYEGEFIVARQYHSFLKCDDIKTKSKPRCLLYLAPTL
jgi:hypothetical protein